MELVPDIMNNAIFSLCNKTWQKNYELFLFNIKNPSETEREIIDCVKYAFSDFIKIHSDAILNFKVKNKNKEDNIGLLWLSYCDSIDLFEKIAVVSRRPRILTI